jgi:hypothetical protein
VEVKAVAALVAGGSMCLGAVAADLPRCPPNLPVAAPAPGGPGTGGLLSLLRGAPDSTGGAVRSKMELLQQVPAGPDARAAVRRLAALPPPRRADVLTRSFADLSLAGDRPLDGPQQEQVWGRLKKITDPLNVRDPVFSRDGQLHVERFRTHADVLIVGGGEPMPGASGLAGNQPVVVHQNGNSLCYAPAKASDFRVDEAGNTANFGFLTDRFREVAAIVEKSSGKRSCSAVVVGPGHVLTAGHCVNRKQGTQVFPGFDTLFAVLVPRGNSPDPSKPRRMAGCFSGGADCDYMVGQITGLPQMLPSAAARPVHFPRLGSTGAIPVPDLALMRVTFPQPPDRIGKLAKVSSLAAAPGGRLIVTKAGYGINSQGGGAALVVGYWWSDRSLNVDADGFALMEHEQHDRRAKLCLFDSGGPVFLGPYNGAETQDRTVAAIASGALGSVTTPQGCEESTAEFVQVLTPAITQQICAASGNAVRGCP